jgi:hypothetical protein
MKKFLHLICIIALIWNVLSCRKDETPQNQFPEWLQLKITELDPDQKLCKMTDVTIIKYNGEKYYHIYCGIWSWMYCELFDEHGNRPTWDEKGWNDFFANQKVIIKVPACQN